MTQHHDPVHPDSDHLSPELIADLDEGLLDADSASHAAHHLSQCDQCSATRARLAHVSEALGSLPSVTMPADRVADLEAALRAASQDRAQPAAADTVVPIRSARSRRAGWSTRLVTIAASAAGVLLISAVGFSMLSGSTGANPTTGALAETTQLGDTVSRTVANESGQAYREATFTQQIDTLLVSNSVALTPTSTPSAQASQPTADPYVTATVAGEATTFAARVVDPDVLQACVTGYLGIPDTQPLVVDVGTFKGIPAAVVVMPSTSDPLQVEVYVVDPNCSGPDATLLYWAVVDLPATLQ